MLKKLFAMCQGRHTFFALTFLSIGTALQWLHRLDSTYISFMVTVMGFVLGHSIKESYFKDGPHD